MPLTGLVGYWGSALAHLGQPPAAGVVKHGSDGGIEGLLAACGLYGALQVPGVTPAGHSHVPISFLRSAR